MIVEGLRNLFDLLLLEHKLKEGRNLSFKDRVLSYEKPVSEKDIRPSNHFKVVERDNILYTGKDYCEALKVALNK